MKLTTMADISHEAIMAEIRSDMDTIALDQSLYDEKNFEKRRDALDFLSFQIIDQLDDLLHKTAPGAELNLVKRRAEKLKTELDEIDASLFQQFRKKIQTGLRREEFKTVVGEYINLDSNDNPHHDEPGYDNMDEFINGLLSFQPMPEQTKALEPEMVFYQKTPARIVFELVVKADFKAGDVFFDLGCGLGQVAILVNLLTGVKAVGVEFEPGFCQYAHDCAVGLNLSNITFINADARSADYSEGTVFFMYTPFSGQILQDVLDILRKESLRRTIRIITYGPCTTQVELESWLKRVGAPDDNVYKLAVFSS